jgi:hypothetical protein
MVRQRDNASAVPLLWASHLRLAQAAMSDYSPKLSGVGAGPAVSGVVWGALATGSGDFALGGESFAIFVSSFFGF